MLSRDEWWVATCAACNVRIRIIEVARAQATVAELVKRGMGTLKLTDEQLALAIACASGWRDNRGPGGRGLCPTCVSVDPPRNTEEVPRGSVAK